MPVASFLKTPLHHNAVAGIVAGVLFTVLFFKLSQPMSEAQGPSPEIRGASGPSGFFHKARNFVINNPIMTYIQGEDKTPRIMELLSGHVIIGAAYDDSVRTYPPRCHPGTRVGIFERFTAWFYNTKRVKSLLWLSGPAGVGKSAILQTFAESVKHFVASVFISRPNKRNDPNRIFTTIAYQLAVHIDAYRDFVVSRIATNPHLLNKSMQVQFQVFITEPFGEKKIGVGGPPVAILLDGLDEVEGAEAQRDIIRLISTFTHEHPDVPLAWIIASRPEPHISGTFNEVTIQGRYESESIPIDSTDACQDVERYLRNGLYALRDEFPHLPLRNWPEETALAKLAGAASGLFIFAETATRFIRDPDHADPIGRLGIVLSVIDHSKDVSTRERPFALLDWLYTEILSQIPPGLWPITKLLLRLTLSFRSGDFLGLSPQSTSRTLRGMTVILQLKPHAVYAALNKCFSMLGIPLWEVAHKQPLTFLHASFADYLMDSKRSGNFHIDMDGIEDDVLLLYVKLWHEHFGSNSTSSWHSLMDECDAGTQGTMRDEMDEFKRNVFADMRKALLSQIIMRHTLQQPVSPVSQQKRLQCLDLLSKVNMISLCNWAPYPYSHGHKMWDLLRRHYVELWIRDYRNQEDLRMFVRGTLNAWQKFPHELGKRGLLHQVSFKDTNIRYRNEETSKAEGWISVESSATFAIRMWLTTTPPYQKSSGSKFFSRASGPSEASISRSTEAFLSKSPKLPVLICGAVPEGRVALFQADARGLRYFIVPYRK